LIDLFQRRVDVFDIGFMLNRLVPHKMQDYFGHTARRAITRTLEDHILHGSAAQVFHSLLTQNRR
jgi:hypothetical protein